MQRVSRKRFAKNWKKKGENAISVEIYPTTSECGVPRIFHKFINNVPIFARYSGALHPLREFYVRPEENASKKERETRNSFHSSANRSLYCPLDYSQRITGMPLATQLNGIYKGVHGSCELLTSSSTLRHQAMHMTLEIINARTLFLLSRCTSDWNPDNVSYR